MKKRLRQILINLLSNAVKVTRQKATICSKVNYRNQSGGICHFRGHRGLGIKDEHLQVIFDPFERVRDISYREFTRHRVWALTIVKLLTEVMGLVITG